MRGEGGRWFEEDAAGALLPQRLWEMDGAGKAGGKDTSR